MTSPKTSSAKRTRLAGETDLPEESGTGYPEEQPGEVADDTGQRDPEQDPSGGEQDDAPDNEDGTATGNPGAAG